MPQNVNFPNLGLYRNSKLCKKFFSEIFLPTPLPQTIIFTQFVMFQYSIHITNSLGVTLICNRP